MPWPRRPSCRADESAVIRSMLSSCASTAKLAPRSGRRTSLAVAPSSFLRGSRRVRLRAGRPVRPRRSRACPVVEDAGRVQCDGDAERIGEQGVVPAQEIAGRRPEPAVADRERRGWPERLRESCARRRRLRARPQDRVAHLQGLEETSAREAVEALAAETLDDPCEADVADARVGVRATRIVFELGHRCESSDHPVRSPVRLARPFHPLPHAVGGRQPGGVMNEMPHADRVSTSPEARGARRDRGLGSERAVPREQRRARTGDLLRERRGVGEIVGVEPVCNEDGRGSKRWPTATATGVCGS